MKFTVAPTTEDFLIHRLTSENNVWEVGIYPVLFGIRVAANPVGEIAYTINYCCGNNPEFSLVLLATVVGILESLPESISEREVSRLFPTYKVRPIDKDECWIKLQEMLTSRETIE